MAEPVMCDATFREGPVPGRAKGERVEGICRDCQQRVRAVILRDGVGRIPYHEVAPAEEVRVDG